MAGVSCTRPRLLTITLCAPRLRTRAFAGGATTQLPPMMGRLGFRLVRRGMGRRSRVQQQQLGHVDRQGAIHIGHTVTAHIQPRERLQPPNGRTSRMYTRNKASVLSHAVSAAALLFVTLIGATAFTRPAPTRGTVAPAQLGEARLVAHHQVDMSKAPSITSAAATGSVSTTPKAQPAKDLPFLTTVSPAEFAQIKAYAATNPHAPHSTHSLSIPPSANVPAPSGSIAPKTASTNNAFAGMENTPTSCPYFGSGGCTPPSMALAASPNWVFEGVNMSFAVYDTSGTLQPGWPKSFQAFFNVPSPGACDPKGPFLANPRAFYDPNDNRFWALVVQIEGAQAFVAPSCPFQSLAWIAVSPVSTPIGTWNVYSFNLNQNGAAAPFATTYAGFGFDGQAVYWSSNMYDAATAAFQYAEVFEANKASMEANLHNFTAMGFFPLRIPNPAASMTPPGPGPNAVMADSVQPVLTESKSYDPRAEFLVSTFNLQGDLAGHDCSTTPCTQFIAWAFSNPIAHDSGGDPPTLTYVFPTTQSYVVAPNADTAPGCTGCIRSGVLSVQTGDLGIIGMPVYHDGLVTFAWEVGVNNGTQVVPGIQWSQ